jgi:hypothetical protein
VIRATESRIRRIGTVKHEYEAKFLSVDVADLQAKLTALGAVQAFPRTLLTRRHGRDPLAARAP